jgi:hypothetical protein
VNAAPSHWTRRSLGVGTAVSAACFVVALALDLAGRDGATGDPSDLAGLARSVAALEPWGWATLGTLAVILTPAVGLLATAVEYRRVADRRTALTAVVVLGVLGVSLLAGLLA